MIVKSLHQVGGQQRVITLFTQASLVTVGRKSDSGVLLNGTLASRAHAIINDIPETKNIAVEDTSSTNGTFCNNLRITTRATVIPGDVLAFPGAPDSFVYKVTDEAVNALDLPAGEASVISNQ